MRQPRRGGLGAHRAVLRLQHPFRRLLHRKRRVPLHRSLCGPLLPGLRHPGFSCRFRLSGLSGGRPGTAFLSRFDPGKSARFNFGVLSNDCSKSGKAPLCRTLTDHCRQDCGTRNSYVDFDYSDYRGGTPDGFPEPFRPGKVRSASFSACSPMTAEKAGQHRSAEP